MLQCVHILHLAIDYTMAAETFATMSAPMGRKDGLAKHTVL